MSSHAAGITKIEMLNKCRVCLLKKGTNSMFAVYGPEKIHIREIFEKYTGIKVNDGDAKPKSLCSTCFDSLVTTDEFVRKCKTSDIVLYTLENIWNSREADNQEVLVEQNTTACQRERDHFVVEETDVKNEPLEVINKEINCTDMLHSNAKDGTVTGDVLYDLNCITFNDDKVEVLMSEQDIKNELPNTTDLINNHNDIDIESCLEDFTQMDCDEDVNPGNCFADKPLQTNADMYDLPKIVHIQTENCVQTNITKNESNPSGETCNICFKVFQHKMALINHIHVHTNENPYRCSQCLATFTVRGNLKRHLWAHCRKKAYKNETVGKGVSSCSSHHADSTLPNVTDHSYNNPNEFSSDHSEFVPDDAISSDDIEECSDQNKLRLSECYKQTSNYYMKDYSPIPGISHLCMSDEKIITKSCKIVMEDIGWPTVSKILLSNLPRIANSNEVNEPEEPPRSPGITMKHEACSSPEILPALVGPKEKNTKRKLSTNSCYFCKAEVKNFVRHLARKHFTETVVQNILALPPKNAIRLDLIVALRKKGNYLKNINTCSKPVRMTQGASNTDYIPCKFCFGYYKPKRLWRHVKTCKFNNGEGTLYSYQSDSQNLLTKHMKVNKHLKETVFPRMLPDKVSLVVKMDILICKFGSHYLSNRKQSYIVGVCSRRMRELAKLLIELKNLNPSIKDMYDALQPIYFDLFVTAVKNIAKFDPIEKVFKSSTVVTSIHVSLKQCCNIALEGLLKHHCIDSEISQTEAEGNIKVFKELLETTWRLEMDTIVIASHLHNRMRSTVNILPLTEDLKIFRDYLLTKTELETAKLGDNKDVNGYKALTELIFCNIVLLNRIKVRDIERTELHNFQSTTMEENSDSFENVMTPTEKILMTTFKKVVIKLHGHMIPILLSTDLQQQLQLWIEKRDRFINRNNIYLFPKLNSSNHINGYQVIKTHAEMSGTDNSEALASFRMRTCIATVFQIFHMSFKEIETLMALIGCTSHVVDEMRELKDPVSQAVKIYQLLRLKENDEPAELKETVHDIELISNEDKATESYRVTKTRKLVPWTNQQKYLTKKFFKYQIKNCVPPKKGECEELKMKHSDIFENKSWPQIKVFVCNIYNK